MSVLICASVCVSIVVAMVGDVGSVRVGIVMAGRL